MQVVDKACLQGGKINLTQERCWRERHRIMAVVPGGSEKPPCLLEVESHTTVVPEDFLFHLH